MRAAEIILEMSKPLPGQTENEVKVRNMAVGVLQKFGVDLADVKVKTSYFDKWRKDQGSVISIQWPDEFAFITLYLVPNDDEITWRVSLGDVTLPHDLRGKGLMTAIVQGISSLVKSKTLAQTDLNVHIPQDREGWRKIISRGGLKLREHAGVARID